MILQQLDLVRIIAFISTATMFFPLQRGPTLFLVQLVI